MTLLKPDAVRMDLLRDGGQPGCLAQAAWGFAGVLGDETGKVGRAAKPELVSDLAHGQVAGDQQGACSIQLTLCQDRGGGLAGFGLADAGQMGGGDLKVRGVFGHVRVLVEAFDHTFAICLRKPPCGGWFGRRQRAGRYLAAQVDADEIRIGLNRTSPKCRMPALFMCDFLQQAVQSRLIPGVRNFQVQGIRRHGHRRARRHDENLSQTLPSQFNRPQMSRRKEKGVMRSKASLMSIHQTAPLTAGDPDQDVFPAIMRQFGLPRTVRSKTGERRNAQVLGWFWIEWHQGSLIGKIEY